MVAAHACLATNRNNRALERFAATREPADLKQWEEWTGKLLAEAPRNTVALYLHGDALARLGRVEEATVSLNQCITADPGFALAYLTQGVLRLMGQPRARMARCSTLR